MCPSPQAAPAQPLIAPADVPVAGENPPATPTSPAKTAEIVTPPVRLRTIEAVYPASARAAQLEGDVLLQAVVGPDGKVRDVTVVRSVHPLLDEAARRAVQRYEYTPGQRNGTPEAATVRLTVSFRLR